RGIIADAAFVALRAWPWMMGMDYQAKTPDQIRHLDAFIEDALTLPWARFEQKHYKAKPKFDSSPFEHLQKLHGVDVRLMDSWPSRTEDELRALHEYLHASLSSAPFVIRVNRRKARREDLLKLFEAHSPFASEWASDAILFPERVPLTDHPA